MQDSLEPGGSLTATGAEEGTDPPPDQTDRSDRSDRSDPVPPAKDNADDEETTGHGSLVLYCLTQIGCVLTVGTGLALPLALVLNYHGAFHTGCHDKSAVYEAMDDWKLLGTYVSLETLVTRTWLVTEVQRCLALADGRPLHHWAGADRMVWASGAFATALLLDVGAIVWGAQAQTVCDETKRTADEMRSLQGVCDHSVRVDAGMQTLHYANTGLCVAVYALLVLWWRGTRSHEEEGARGEAKKSQ